MALRHSDIHRPGALMSILDCAICGQPVIGADNVAITGCLHKFHLNCLRGHLENNTYCPICEASLNIADFPAEISASSKRIKTGAAQGAIRKPKTRADTFRADQPKETVPQTIPDQANVMELSCAGAEANNSVASDNVLAAENARTPEFVNSRSRHAGDDLSLGNLVESLTRIVDSRLQNGLEEISRKMGEQIKQLSLPSPRREPDWPRDMPFNSSNGSFGAGPRNFRGFSPIRSRTNSGSLNPGQISNIIQGWQIQFNGSSSGPSVEKFIYQVTALTKDCFGGDFQILSDNSYLLFSGPAKEWYWRYRRTVSRIKWKDLCEALRYDFQDPRNDLDVRELIRARKQRDNESFEDFYNSVLGLADRLHSPISEYELVEILQRNLRMEIRQQIFMIPVNNVAHLKSLCQRREALCAVANRPRFQPQRVPMNRQVHELEVPEPDPIEENEVCEMNSGLVCWNCRTPGHRYHDCLEKRTVFCYGCGGENTYRPNCQKCAVPENRQRSGGNKNAPRSTKLN